MGWVNLGEEVFNKDVIAEDLASLPAEVITDVSEDSVAQCAEEAMAEYTNHP